MTVGRGRSESREKSACARSHSHSTSSPEFLGAVESETRGNRKVDLGDTDATEALLLSRSVTHHPLVSHRTVHPVHVSSRPAPPDDSVATPFLVAPSCGRRASSMRVVVRDWCTTCTRRRRCARWWMVRDIDVCVRAYLLCA